MAIAAHTRPSSVPADADSRTAPAGSRGCPAGRLAPAGTYDISYEWDDSVIVDTQSEQVIRMQEVAAGLLRPEQYLMWRYGVSEQDAKAMMPDAFDGGDG